MKEGGRRVDRLGGAGAKRIAFSVCFFCALAACSPVPPAAPLAAPPVTLPDAPPPEGAEALPSLVEAARRAVMAAWEDGIPAKWQDYPYGEIERGVIVRFVAGKEPRGCLCFYRGVDDLLGGARIAALDAAFHDARYAPIVPEEAANLDIEVDIVGPLVPMAGPMDFALGVQLVYMLHPNGSVMMQPSLAREFNWSAEDFLEALCKKAGLPKGAWKDPGVRFLRAAVLERREHFITGSE